MTLATVTMALGEDEVQLDQREQASVMQVSVSRAAAHPEGPQECQRAPHAPVAAARDAVRRPR